MKKRLLSILLIGVMSLSLLACSNKTDSQKDNNKGNAENKTDDKTDNKKDESEEIGTKTPNDFKKFIIGVAEPQAIDEVVIRRDYYENYIAPRYNVEFIFSEQVKSADDELSFIENCADAGADAIISYRGDDTDQMAQVCREYGMVYAINYPRNMQTEDVFAGGYENFTGGFTADQPYVGSLFGNWLASNASEDGSEGFIITTAMAFRGNAQHIESTLAVLKAIQDKYGLTYEDTIENITVTSAPLEVANDKNIRIYIYPGSVTTNEGWLQGVSAALQTGNYGVFIQTGQTFPSTAVVVDEVEKTFDIDIKVASVASMSESLTNAFNTQDRYGNPSLNMATVKSTSLVSSMGFVKVYNALTGYNNLNIDAAGDQGVIMFRMWGVETPEQVNALSTWDIAGGGKWVFDNSLIDRTLGIYNPELTFEDIQEVYYSVSFEDALSRLN